MNITRTQHTPQRITPQRITPQQIATPKPEVASKDQVAFSGGDDNDYLSGGLALGSAAIGGTLAYLGTTSSNPLISVPAAALSIAGAGAVVGGGIGLARDLSNFGGHEDHTKKGAIIGASIGVGVGIAAAALTNHPAFGVATAVAGAGTAAIGAWIATQS